MCKHSTRRLRACVRAKSFFSWVPSFSASVTKMLGIVARAFENVASTSTHHVLRASFVTTAPLRARAPRARNWKTPVGHPSPRPLADSPLLADDGGADHSPSAPISVDSLPDAPRTRQAHVGPTPKEVEAHRAALQAAFPSGWSPPRKLSREAMDGLRQLHAHDPATFSTPVLAERFRVSPEAVRRILRSRWEPGREERARMAKRDRKSREEWIEKRREDERKEKMRMREDKDNYLTFG